MVAKYILAVMLALGLGFASNTGNQAVAPALQASSTSASAAVSKPYHIVKTFPLPFLKRLGGRFAFETTSRRLFVADGKDLIVINADTGETLGTISKVGYASDIAFALELQRGFVVDSERGGLVDLDLEKLTVLKKVHKVAESSLALYDAKNKKLFLASAQSKDCQVFDPLTNTVIASVKLGGYPLQGLDDSFGHIYFELGPEAFRDPRALGLPYDVSPALPLGTTGEITVLDGQSLQISGRWKEPLCKNMRLIGMDHAHGRLFAGCGDSLATIDLQTDIPTLSAPIPVKLLWYLQFNEDLGDVFAVVAKPPTLIALHENSSGEFDRPVIATKGFPGYMVADGKTGTFFVLQSDVKAVDTGLYAAIPGAAMQPLRTSEPVPGTFRFVVYGKN